jgi:hypothetical protein
VLITDIPQFPRSRKIGGNTGIKPHILAGKTLVSLKSRFFMLNRFRRLGTFLQPLLEKETTMQINEEPVIAQRSSPEPSSLFGQPPSALECPDGEEILYDFHDDLDADIANLYKGQNLQNLIMDEVIDEKQNFLMEGLDLALRPLTAKLNFFNALNSPRSTRAELLCSQRNHLSNQVPRICYSSEFESKRRPSPSVLKEDEWETIAQSGVILGVSHFLLCQ